MKKQPQYDIVDVEVIDTPSKPGTGVAVRGNIQEAGGKLRRIRHRNFVYAHTILVNGDPQIASDDLIEQLGVWACVNSSNGTITNGNDRSRALAVLMPRGNFAVIDLDDPDFVAINFSAPTRW